MSDIRFPATPDATEPTRGGESELLATTPPSAEEAKPVVASDLDLRAYELLETLGEGGMGAVHRCGDPALGRDLAIKVMKRVGQAEPEHEGRFVREARITGSLQHPGIVAVHNLGRLTDGRLHYTMRLVRGQTFATILKDEVGKPARLPYLLSIFEKICQAVAYAHSKHVLHRDLKPLNVMVGKFGEVQVMDWGLAKVLGSEDGSAQSRERSEESITCVPGGPSDTPAELTRIGSGFGTPAYMPAEQALGEWDTVDERADVFALGSMLCQILTGEPAYRGSDVVELYRQAKRGDVSEARERLQQCGADEALTALCGECLSPRPDSRPRDAGDLAKRLAAYQEAVQERLRQAELERVAAETQTRAEQARALVEQERAREALARAAAERRARRRTRYLAGALLVLLLGGGVGIVAVNRERHLTATALAAEKRRRGQTREALDAMFSEVIEDWLAKKDQLSDEQRKYLENALVAYEEFAQDTGQDEEAQRGLAGAYLRIATIRARLGRTAEAEDAYRRGQKQFAALVAAFPNRSEYREGLGMSRSGLGNLLRGTRRWKEAEAAYRGALTVFTQAAADFPANHRLRGDLSDSRLDLARMLKMNSQLPEAEAEFRAALVLAEQLSAEFPDNVEFSSVLGEIQYNLSHLYLLRERRVEAEAAARAALAVRERLAARFPTRAGVRNVLARSYLRLGSVLQSAGRSSEAVDVYRKALPLLKQLANDFPGRPAYQNEVAEALVELAEASTAKEPEQARRLLAEAVPYSQVALQAKPGDIDYLAILYMNYSVQVGVSLKLHDHVAAAAAAETAETACHTPEDIYEYVCAYCECVKVAAQDAKLSESKQQELRKSYSDRAMNALRRAVEFGYREVATLRKDKRLDPLRSRDDFQKLLNKLEKPAR